MDVVFYIFGLGEMLKELCRKEEQNFNGTNML